MEHKIFINLAIQDLSRSMDFYTQLGFTNVQVSSIEEMNAIADKAAAGAIASNPLADYGFMQQRSFLDPDEHHWEIFFMDMDKFRAQA